MPIYIKPWSTNVDWLLSDPEDKSRAKRIAEETPTEIQGVMASLNKLKQVNAYYSGDYLTSRGGNKTNLCLVFVPEHIRKAEINLLSALKQKPKTWLADATSCYTLTYADKRLVVEAQERGK